jgi:hypothetical protein
MGGNIYLEENGIGKQAYVFRNITNPPSYYEENQIGWERPITWKQNRHLSILYS